MNVEGVLKRLEQLVAFDTQNPPRDLDAGSPIFSYVTGSLDESFDVDVIDHGLGRVSLLAVRGTPSLLFNVHLDTVPISTEATFPALEMTRHEDRVYGRGVCDIKGAAACLLEIADHTDDPMAMLFTSDEEGASGCCIHEFVASGKMTAFSQVVVAEPTDCLAVLSHRGYLSVKGRFTGSAGHSSEPRALRDNALHKLSTWVAAAVQQAAELERENRRPCFNVGEVHGGVKSNVIADDANLHWSARLSPGDSNEEFLAIMSGLEHGDLAQWHVPFSGPPLPTSGMDVSAARAFVKLNSIETGSPVDFWTEASLFAQAGVPAIVLGPGNIAQAHAVDEWVSIEQLDKALNIYVGIIQAQRVNSDD